MAVGTPFAIIYANIYMPFWMKVFGHITPHNLDICYRFIDDIYAFSSDTTGLLQEFISKVSMEMSVESIPFLDVRVEGRKEMFYLTTRSTHFLFTVIWRRTYGK